MKKISILLILILLTSCTWNYKNGDIQKNIDAQEVQKLEKELTELEQQKAIEALEKIKLENEIASEVLANFLKSETFDIKAEIAKTKEKYNDNLGPILEYQHEKIKKSEEETATGSTQTGTTQSGALTENTTGNNNQDIQESRDKIYSGEVIIANLAEESEKEIKEEQKTTTKTKTGKSGIYTMYIGGSDSCTGGLEMEDLEKNKTWLFSNTCDKKIYNFDLAIGGINVHYNIGQGIQKSEFISIK